MWRRRFRQLREALFDGDVTLSKTDFWLAALVCLLAGIVFGFLKAPWTHGVTISSNNGNQKHYYGARADEEQIQQEREADVES